MTTSPSFINGVYPINLTPDRHDFHVVRPGWERERLARQHEVTTPGMCVYDIGAESGDFTALYHLWVGESGTVIPIEPQPPYWPSIRAHWEGNDLPSLKWYFPGFASDRDRATPPVLDSFSGHIHPDESGWPICSLGKVMPDFGFRHLAQQTNHTPQLTIDSMVVASQKVPDIIVMDIEGAEYHALTGAVKTMAELHPIMFVSMHPATMLDWYKTTPQMILDLMASFGYTGEKLGEDSEEYFVFMPPAGAH